MKNDCREKNELMKVCLGTVDILCSMCCMSSVYCHVCNLLLLIY